MPSVPTSCGAGGYIIPCVGALAAHLQCLIHNLEGNRRSATPGKFQRCCARSFAISSCTVTVTERVTAGVLLPPVSTCKPGVTHGVDSFMHCWASTSSTAENPPPGSELQFHQDLDILVWFVKYWPTAPSSILASGGPWSGSTPYSAVPSSPLLHAHTSTLERPRHSVYSQPFLKSDGGSTWFSVQCYPLPCS